MHQELLMHVAAGHIQDRQRFADQQRAARQSAPVPAARRRRRFRWALSHHPQAQSVSPSH